MANGGFKELFIEIFAWWRGATWGTRFWIARNGVFVGEDEFGNRYYRSKTPTGPHGMERRMVVYAGDYADASAIPSGWYGWMHYKTNRLPTDEAYVPHAWEKPHLRNLTGTAGAYRPDGSMMNKGQRPRVTGDYDAWSPE